MESGFKRQPDRDFKPVQRPCLRRHDEGALGPDRNISKRCLCHRQPRSGELCASKAGMVGMSKSLAYEVAPAANHVNPVAPGFITTAMTDKLTTTKRRNSLGRSLAVAMGEASEIASAVGLSGQP